MSLTIRSVNYKDFDFIVNCENENFHNFTNKSKIEEDYENPLISYYLLVDKKQIFGYINLWIDENKAQINSMVIINDFRNKGYGTKFMDFIFHKLQDQGVNEITLEVRPSNLAALKMYEKSGFRQVAVRKGYYNNGEDAFLMYRRLGSD